MSQHYELVYIVPIKYLDDELQTITQSVNGLIKKFVGEIVLESSLGRQRLAYPINQVHQGTYNVVEFDMNEEEIKKFSRELGMVPEVLRFLIICKKVKTEKEIKKEEQIKAGMRRAKEEELAKIEEEDKGGMKKLAEAPTPTAESKPEKIKQEAKKTSLEELDKKLDEILSDDIL